MVEPIPLVVKAEPVPRVSLGPQKSRSPSIAVVYATAAGDLHVLDGGRPMNWSDHLLPPYRTRYEVDLSDHVRTVELRSSPPMAAGGAYGFETILNVGFRVSDPAEVVRRNIRDGLTVVYDHLVFVCRQLAASYGIEEAKDAEAAINFRFSQPDILPEGITIYRCLARLQPDVNARRYLQAQVESRRSNVVKAAEHEVHVEDAVRENELALLRQSGRLEERTRERQALGGRPLTARELIALHLERHPDDTEQALRLLGEAEKVAYDRSESAEQRSRDLFAFMVEHELIRPVDVARYRDQAMLGLQGEPQRVQVPPAVAGWDDPLPDLSAPASLPVAPASPPVATAAAADVLRQRVISVYLVVDESLNEHVEDLNVGIRALYDALAFAPDIANVVRLSVFGFAADIDVQLALATVGQSTRPPRLTPRGPASYGAAFQQLLDCIPRDVETLKAQNGQTMRPQVVFLTGAEPSDAASWAAVHRRLVDRDQLQAAPDIIACGVGTADPTTIARIATQPEYAFIDTHTDVRRAIAEFNAFVRSHVLKYGRAILDGQSGPKIVTPDGFSVVSEITA